MALQRATASSILEGQRWFYTKLQDDAKNAASHKNMAALLMGQNRIEMAVRHYEAALKINATDPSLSNDMGVALMALGKHNRAREFFQQALDVSPNGEYHAAHTNMAALFAKNGDWRHALKHCQEALRLNPNDAAAQRNIARIYMKSGRTKEALYANERALALSGGHGGRGSTTHARAAVQAIALGYTDRGQSHNLKARRLGGRQFAFTAYHPDDRVRSRPDFERLLTDDELQKRSSHHGRLV